MTYDVRRMLDPVPVARDEGRKQGRREMRDRIRQELAAFAASHPVQEISDELWTFVGFVDRMDTT